MYIPGNVIDLVNGRWFQVKADSGIGYEGVEGSPMHSWCQPAPYQHQTLQLERLTKKVI